MNHTFKLSVSYVNINQEGMMISANGQNFVWFDERQRVAIGNVRPDYKLDVTGDGRFTSNLNVEGTLKTEGAIYRSLTDRTSNYTILDGDDTYIITNKGATGDYVITLPDPATNVGRELIFIGKVGIHEITVNSHSGGSIIQDSAGSTTSSTACGQAGEMITMISCGDFWNVVSKR